MKQLGGLLVLFGVGSIVLNLLGREFVILLWIDNWGPTVGWAIRGGAIVAGAILFFLGWRAERGTPAPRRSRFHGKHAGIAAPDLRQRRWSSRSRKRRA